MKRPALDQWLKEFDSFFNQASLAVPQNNTFDLVGTENSCWKFLVNEKGCVTIETQLELPERAETDHYTQFRRTLLTLFSPEKEGFGSFTAALSHQCLDGWLPVSVVTFQSSRFQQVRETVLTDEKGMLHIAVETEKGTSFYTVTPPDTQDPKAVWLMDDPKAVKMADGNAFEQALQITRRHWQEKFASLLQWDFPHVYLKNGILSALAKCFITQYNGALRYGGTRYYCDEAETAESFPPTIITMTESCLFYGLADEGSNFFSIFTDKFVSEAGVICHRGNGASISEHGMILDVFTRCCLVTKDEDFIRRHLPVMKAMAKNLLDQIRDAAPGIISGCPEDDLRFVPYKQWFSSNLWAAKGLLGFARIAPETVDQVLVKAFAEQTVQLCQKSVIKTPTGDFVPPCPEVKEPFNDMNDFLEFLPGDVVHSLASYTNYRFYPEMLSSCLLPRELAQKIVDYRNTHNGDFYGVTTFRLFRSLPVYGKERCLDDWPLFNHLQALAFYGDHTELARCLAGHMAIHQGRFTYFAPETSFRDHLDSAHCVPSQLTLPLAIRALFPEWETIPAVSKD